MIGSDPEWRKSKNKHMGLPDEESNGDVRYREWDNLKYWFRGVEKFAPWVNNVYFVTCGHYPEWLNLDCPKLKFVKHADYIPAEYLPTFSANPIEINLHRINGLSEKFVYFNDDMFLIDHVKEEDFFKNNLPLRRIDEGVLPGPSRLMSGILMSDAWVINKNFSKREVLKKTFSKYFNFKSGFKANLRKICLAPFPNFSVMTDPHLPSPLLKSTFEEVWNKELDILSKTSENKFRTSEDVNQYLFKVWDVCEGNYVPTKYKKAKAISVTDDNYKEMAENIRKQKYNQICLNDEASTKELDKIMKEINVALESILPEKSMFER